MGNITKQRENKMNTKEVKTVTMEELTQLFNGKYVNISPMDHYGISISMLKATVEYEDELSPELWFVVRDKEGNVTGSVCIDDDSIESIEAYEDGKYIVNFNLNMTSIEISEYKILKAKTIKQRIYR